MRTAFETHLDIRLFYNGLVNQIPATKIIEFVSRAGQKIEVYWTEMGNCLVINDVIQSAKGEGRIYDQMLTKALSFGDSRVLILGGGDGSLAREILDKNPCCDVVVVDRDYDVIEVSKSFMFGQTVFDDPRVCTVVEDVIDFLEGTTLRNIKFDGIVVDLTDNPIRAEGERFESFYQKLIPLIAKSLTSRGWISVQVGTEEVCNKYINASCVIGEIVAQRFESVSFDTAFVPSFMERAKFLYACGPHHWH